MSAPPRQPSPPGSGGHDDRVEIERLSKVRCWELLAGVEVGRLGLVVAGVVEIFPINYLVDRTTGVLPTLLFRTDPGTKLTGLAHNPQVTFEVDQLDPTDRTGWSVVVKGRVQQVDQIPDPDRRQRFDRMPLDHWHGQSKRHSCRIVPTVVTGRRITRTAASALTPPPATDWCDRPVWIPPPG